MKVLHRLVDEGNTVIVIEHNLSIIAEADYLVDIGPEAGAEGGEIVATGTPEEVAKSRISRTAPFLREVLKAKPGRQAVILSRVDGEGPHGRSYITRAGWRVDVMRSVAVQLAWENESAREISRLLRDSG